MSTSSSATNDKRSSKRLWLIAALLLLIVAVCLADAMREDLARAQYPKQYSAYVEKYAAAYELPPHLVYAVILTESDFNSGAVSSAGAQGLMQLMPSTFRWLSDDVLREGLESGMVLDPETNIRYGCCYLAYLFDRYTSVEAVLAAYNAGPSRVNSWLADDTMVDAEGALIPERIPDPFGETRHYVTRVLTALSHYDALYTDTQKKQ